MKLLKVILLSIVAFLVFSLNTAAQESFLVDKFERIETLKNKLNLNETQVKQIKTIIKNNLTEDDFKKSKLNNLYTQFKSEKAKINPNKAKIDLLIDQITAARAENAKKRYAAQTKIKQVLTASQIKQLKQIVKKRKENIK